MSDSGTAQPYRVALIGDVPAVIRRLAAEAALRDIKQVYLDAFRAIQQRLANDPAHFGERRYTLLNGELPCYIGAIRPVAVHFGIHEEQRAVLILKVFLMGS